MTDHSKSAATQPYRTTTAAQEVRKEILHLEELIDLISKAWPERYVRGRIMHVHRNAIRTAGGGLIHLRVLVQQVADDDQVYNQADNTE